MKTYIKPTIDFIELKSEERLACTSNGSGSGCCSGGGQNYFAWIFCSHHGFPMGWLCNFKTYNKCCKWW